MLAPCFVLTGQPCTLTALSGPDVFEIHLTTVALQAASLRAYRQACQELHVKAIVIELAPGLPVQPMTCLRVMGRYDDALGAAHRLSETLTARGFPTLRVKIEAAPWNASVPATDDATDAEPAGRYFEFHARVLLKDNAHLTVLAGLCAKHGAHVSRNPLKVRDDGQQERFVTLRCSGVGRATCEARTAALVDDLRASDWTIASTVLEYCLHDDHLDLDGGWGKAVSGAP